MATVNVKAMALPDLIVLRDEVLAEIAAKQVEARASFVDEMRELAAARGLDLKELVDIKRGARRGAATGTVVAKYRNPANVTETWAGRGRQPVWVREHVEGGGSLEDLLIDKATAAPKRKRKKEDVAA